MDKPVPVEPVFFAPPSAGPVEDARVAVVWTLGDPGRDLDAKVVRLGAGAVTGEGGGTTVGLLLVVVAGSGEVRTPGRAVALAPGSAAWLPTGTPHSVRAGDDGLTYTQAHRRRPRFRGRGRRFATAAISDPHPAHLPLRRGVHDGRHGTAGRGPPARDAGREQGERSGHEGPFGIRDGPGARRLSGHAGQRAGALSGRLAGTVPGLAGAGPRWSWPRWSPCRSPRDT